MTWWLILKLLAAGLLLAPGLAAANPWGIGDNQGAAQRPAPDAPAYRFREDAGADLPAGAAAGTRAGSAGVADTPAPPAPAYRFRGDPSGLVGAGGGGPDGGSYRFRPLTERELERHGQGADPGLRPGRAPPAGPPGWPDGRAGPWPSR